MGHQLCLPDFVAKPQFLSTGSNCALPMRTLFNKAALAERVGNKAPICPTFMRLL